jgi:hypothetical protein
MAWDDMDNISRCNNLRDSCLPNELLSLRNLIFSFQLADIGFCLLSVVRILQLVHVLRKERTELRVLKCLLKSLGFLCFDQKRSNAWIQRTNTDITLYCTYLR